MSFETDASILDVAKTAFERVLEIQARIEILGIELEKAEDEKKLTEYTDLLHEMDVLDGYSIDHKTEDVLHGLGFSQNDLLRPYKEFSGGWRMRVLLAKMILMQPDLLMLDEPTNHLDLPSIEWLEKYLSHYQGAVVIVSHDKFFLNRMVNKIVELYQRRLHIYSGNYTYYENEKALRVELQQRAFQNQQDFIRQQERFIERFKAKASKATQAQSVQKRLDKLERVEEAVVERPNIRINFSIDKVPGKVICTLKNIGKQFGDIRILNGGTAEIERGDKIALIGANGKGKSTLLRIIADREPFEGERNWGHNVDESFYAQHQLEHLRLDNTVLEEMQTAGSNKTDLELRTVLGCFLFSGEDVDKRIRVLSGGEKARVALAKTIISKANFLMLDEPTNHLDMHSVDLLAEALDKYEGSLILVSHDRYFISRTANKIWEIVDEKIVEFKGNYTEWVEWKERMRAQLQVKADPKPEKQVVVAKPAPVSIDKEKQKEKKKLQKRFDELETKLNQLRLAKTEMEAQLGNPEIYTQKEAFATLEKKYQTISQDVRTAEKDYEKLFEDLMNAE